MSWYRVELDDDGKVLRLKRCADGGPGTMTVFYVWADDEEAAKRLAERERQRMMLKARRKAYKEQGLCRCGREREEKRFSRCITCRARQATYHQRAYERAQGRPIETPSKSESFVRRHASVRESERLTTLLHVKALFLECRTNREFVDRLKGEIEGLTKREAA